MKVAIITSNQAHLKAEIILPASKSISNRALILSAVCQQINGNKPSLLNLSTADDTRLLSEALTKTTGIIDIKNAGTCLRFLTAYYAATLGIDIILTGSKRMQERPVAPLVEALHKMGASISYTEKKNCLPIHIIGRKLNGGNIQIDGSNSSQFISALMLIAPLLTEDLQLTTSSHLLSKPYISMTASMLGSFGFNSDIFNEFHTISIQQKPVNKTPQSYSIEADWSSAAFFYQAAFLADSAEIIFPQLSKNSIQGDSILQAWFQPLGILTEEHPKGLRIYRKYVKLADSMSFDFTNYPDLAPAIICMLAAAGIACEAKGLSGLIHKESNRLLAIKETLKLLHFKVETDEETYLKHDGLQHAFYGNQVLDTHTDHRLVMAYTMLSIQLSALRLSETESVEKSFPAFFAEIRKIGIKAP